MRIRQVKPSWWTDKELHTRLTAEIREFYIGLWMIADDSGWLVWDITKIAAELYPYSHVATRERHVATWSERLVNCQPDSPHLSIFDCGHARVPKMPGHQRIAGNQTFSVRDKHLAESKSLDVATGSHGRGIGRERNGRVETRAGAATNDELLASFRRRGLPVDAPDHEPAVAGWLEEPSEPSEHVEPVRMAADAGRRR